MADYVTALFNGGGTLATYTPDVGAAFIDAAPVDPDDGFNFEAPNYFTSGGPYTFADLAISGGMLAPTVVSDTYTAALKFGTQPSQNDYFIEIGVYGDLAAASLSILLAARVTAQTGAAGEWTNGINYAGMAIYPGVFSNSYNVDSYDTFAATNSVATVYTDPTDYGGTPQEFVFRMELIGNQRTFIANGSIVHTDTLTAPVLASGDAYVFLAWDVTSFAGLSVTYIRLGHLPETASQFWKDFVLTREID